MAQELVPGTQERFRMLVDTAPVMVWMAGPDALRTFFNRRWLEFTGCALAEELGAGWISSVHPDDRASCVDTYRRAFEAREQFTMEYRLRRADGVYHWLLDTGVPHWEQGVFAGYLGSCVDISDRKRAEEQLQEREQILEQRVAERTRELTTLLEVARTVGSTLELKPLMALILEQLKAVVAHDGSAVFILEQNDELSLLHYSGPLQLEELALRWPLAHIDHVRAVIRGAGRASITLASCRRRLRRGWVFHSSSVSRQSACCRWTIARPTFTPSTMPT